VGKGFSFAEPTFEGEGDDAEEGEGEGAGEEDQEGGQEEQGEGAEEPEDDYNAAWEVLDVARTIYIKLLEESQAEMKEEKMKLADTYLALGDVSCETGKLFFLGKRGKMADRQKTSRRQ
jgi:HAT1-interacting factor 1